MPPPRRIDAFGRLVDVPLGVTLVCDCCRLTRIRGESIADVNARAVAAGWRWLRARRRAACPTCIAFARAWVETAGVLAAEAVSP